MQDEIVFAILSQSWCVLEMAASIKNPLEEQRAELRFDRAVDVVLQAAGSIKKINSQELAHLNQILTDSSDDPWRFQPVEIQIPSGQVHHFNLVSNPIQKARDITGTAVTMVGNQEVVEAGLYVYTELVLAHLFHDANRRTAVLATVWVLTLGGYEVDARQLLNVPLGDLRNKAHFAAFRHGYEALVSQA